MHHQEIPPHPISLTWKNITVQINQKTILNNISGYCTPGTSLAIMGPSGSGKTTLLSTLSKISDPNTSVTGTVNIYL
jgi:ABC-type multidrug transport system ATPase subunit